MTHSGNDLCELPRVIQKDAALFGEYGTPAAARYHPHMAEPTQPNARRSALLLLLASVTVLLLGAIENLYGLTDSGDLYGSDAVQYLDIARALGRHDWHSALNPLWSQGYPALLALLRPLFAPGPLGDWRAVHTLNFLISHSAMAAFSICCSPFKILFPPANASTRPAVGGWTKPVRRHAGVLRPGVTREPR